MASENKRNSSSLEKAIRNELVKVKNTIHEYSILFTPLESPRRTLIYSILSFAMDQLDTLGYQKAKKELEEMALYLGSVMEEGRKIALEILTSMEDLVDPKSNEDVMVIADNFYDCVSVFPGIKYDLFLAGNDFKNETEKALLLYSNHIVLEENAKNLVEDFLSLAVSKTKNRKVINSLKMVLENVRKNSRFSDYVPSFKNFTAEALTYLCIYNQIGEPLYELYEELRKLGKGMANIINRLE